MNKLVVAALSLAVLATVVQADEQMPQANKQRSWLFGMGYKGHPYNYCQAVATLDKDNQAVCQSFRDYFSTHDKDRAEKFYTCSVGWDCNTLWNHTP